MKKYLLSMLLIVGNEAVSLAVLTIILIMVLCDFAKAAERKGI